jgi:hypothetical protein
MPDGPRVLRVLDADPELGELLSPSDFSEARRRAVATLEVVQPGGWMPGLEPAEAGHLGLLVVDGLLMRDIRLNATVCAELLGHGDLLRPWDEDRAYASTPFKVRWRALRPTRLAVLDRRFAVVACRWPELIQMTLSRTIGRSHALAFYLALGSLKRVDSRLRVLFWYLAERWGRVGVDGVRLPLPLTHEMLAQLVAAKRPSVTTALGQLTRDGFVSRAADGTWVVHGEPPSELDDMPPTTTAASASRAA